MAARLTDRKKKKIIADYIELGSYNAVGKKHGVSATTVKKLVMADTESVKKCEQKKEQNTADILAHMESKKNTVIKIMDAYLEAMLDESKIASATPAQLTTALGTLIDKFTAIKVGASGKDVVDDPLTASLKEEARRMESADQ